MTLLAIPDTGFRRSINVNNVDRVAFSDWLEASILFLGDGTSVSEITDVLVEAGILETFDNDNEVDSDDRAQTVGALVVSEGLNALSDFLRDSKRQSKTMISRDYIGSAISWDEDPYRAFLICLSLVEAYPSWAKACAEIGDQGFLFEEVCAEACKGIFPNWTIFSTGWSENKSRKIADLVADLASELGTSQATDLDDWAAKRAKDAGLDIFCFPTFPDGQEFVPQLAIQCASGNDWTTKLNQPSTNTWQKFLNSSCQARRGITVPFLIEEKIKKEKCLDYEGFLLDRPRLLSTLSHDNSDLLKKITDWCKPRIELLQEMRI